MHINCGVSTPAVCCLPKAEKRVRFSYPAQKLRSPALGRSTSFESGLPHNKIYILYMAFKFFSKNGQILPIQEAVIPLSSIEYAYGFGVYENIRISNGIIYFMKEHLERLAESARIIGLEHQFTGEFISSSINELILKNEVEACNLKILLIGAPRKEDSRLYILCLNPLFPDKKLYRDGVELITYRYERAFPHAKTLNMLQSYLAYRKAKKHGAYDALLLDREGFATEGTRTNFYCINDKKIYSFPESGILPGVTRKALLKIALNNGFELVEKNIKPHDISSYDGAFISSTSSKIIPVRRIDDLTLKSRPDALRELMVLFNSFLEQCGGII